MWNGCRLLVLICPLMMVFMMKSHKGAQAY
ncbi:DUF2933 domain-containing protein [Metabacillus idriensis]